MATRNIKTFLSSSDTILEKLEIDFQPATPSDTSGFDL